MADSISDPGYGGDTRIRWGYEDTMGIRGYDGDTGIRRGYGDTTGIRGYDGDTQDTGIPGSAVSPLDFLLTRRMLTVTDKSAICMRFTVIIIIVIIIIIIIIIVMIIVIIIIIIMNDIRCMTQVFDVSINQRFLLSEFHVRASIVEFQLTFDLVVFISFAMPFVNAFPRLFLRFLPKQVGIHRCCIVVNSNVISVFEPERSSQVSCFDIVR
jgi:hypothetical protein